MSRKPRPTARRSGWPLLLAPILLVILLAATNPDEDQFRSVMRAQDSLMLDAAALLPIERTNFILGSKFEVKYGVGSTVCWGAAAYVFICPPKPE
jgi:hypothetical protein